MFSMQSKCQYGISQCYLNIASKMYYGKGSSAKKYSLVPTVFFTHERADVHFVWWAEKYHWLHPKQDNLGAKSWKLSCLQDRGTSLLPSPHTYQPLMQILQGMLSKTNNNRCSEELICCVSLWVIGWNPFSLPPEASSQERTKKKKIPFPKKKKKVTYWSAAKYCTCRKEVNKKFIGMEILQM